MGLRPPCRIFDLHVEKYLSISSAPCHTIYKYISKIKNNIFLSLLIKISSKSGSVFVVINFDSSNDSTGVGNIFNEINKQPIVLDFFSFGLVDIGNKDINNSIYTPKQ